MKQGKCIISGYVNGQKFRPSNWSERLCEAGAIFDPLKRVMRYSEHLHPRQCEAYGCSVYVNFDALDNELVDYINWFIESNSLESVVLQQKSRKMSAIPTAGIVKPEQAAEIPSARQFRYKSTKTAA